VAPGLQGSKTVLYCETFKHSKENKPDVRELQL